MNWSPDDRPHPRTSGRVLVGFFLVAALWVRASAQSVVGPKGVAYEERTSDYFLADSFYHFDRPWLSIGPSWLMNALPGSRLSNLRSPWLYDRNGDRIESVYRYASDVGTLANPFNVMLFNNVGGFGSGGGTTSKISVPTIAAANSNSTWANTGSTNGNWNEPTNWVGGGVPGATVAITGTNADTSVATFNTAVGTFGTTGSPVVIDSASENIKGITFDTAAGNYFIGTTAGNPIYLSSGGAIQILNTLSATNAVETINAPLVVEGAGGTYSLTNNSANGTGAGAGTLKFGGQISGGAAGTTTLTVNGSNTNLNTVSGNIVNGSATSLAVTKSDTGTWVLSGNNTYSGGTTLSSGTLVLGTSSIVTGGTLVSGPVGTGTFHIGSGSNVVTLTTNAGDMGFRTVENNMSLDGDITFATTTPGPINSPPNSLILLNTLFSGIPPGASFLTTPNTIVLTRTNTLTVNDSVRAYLTGPVSGPSFGIIKEGNGDLLIGAPGYDAYPNTFSGLTSVNAGNLYLGKNANTDAIAGDLFIGSSGAVLLFNDEQINNNSTVTVNGYFVLNGKNETIAALNGFGTVSNFASVASTITLTVGFNNGSGTFEGVIGDGAASLLALTKTGSGTQTLTGINRYTGATTINGGTLSVSNLANGGSNSSIGASSNAASNLVFGGGTLQYTGSTAASTDRLFTIGDSNSATIDASGGIGGTLSFTNNGAIAFGNTNAHTLTLTGTNTGNNTLAASIGDNTGVTSVVKTGGGTWVLSGSSSYTGATTVNGGTLLVNGSTASGSAVTVNNSGTLGGTGTLAGTVMVKSGGTLSPGNGPGNSPGTLTTGALTLENGSTFAVDLTASSGNDVLVAPSVTLGSLGTGPNLVLNITGSLTIGQQFYIVDNTGPNFISGVFAQGSFITSGGYTFVINPFANFDNHNVAGNDIMLQVTAVTAVPEPSTWIGAAMALSAIGFTQRRELRRLVARRS
jgi:fibronectin-binding autotransporter adhesin